MFQIAYNLIMNLHGVRGVLCCKKKKKCISSCRKMEAVVIFTISYPTSHFKDVSTMDSMILIKSTT